MDTTKDIDRHINHESDRQTDRQTDQVNNQPPSVLYARSGYYGGAELKQREYRPRNVTNEVAVQVLAITI